MMQQNTAQQILKLSRTPESGEEAWYAGAKDAVGFLRSNAKATDLVIYASTDCVLIHGVLALSAKINPPDYNDLRGARLCADDSWVIEHSSGGGKDDCVYLDPPLSSPGCKTLTGGEKLIFVRSFEGVDSYKSQVEISQKLVHSLGLYFMPERHAYCRLDKKGDFEDIIKIIRIPKSKGSYEGTIVTVRADSFHEYMTLSGTALIVKFDFTRFPAGSFTGWAHSLDGHDEFPDLFYHYGYAPKASYIHGWQIIRPAISRQDVVEKYKASRDRKSRKYAEFKTVDWKNGKHIETSCSPESLSNYFQKDSPLPFEISPVFFNSEVLQRYKANPEKYTLESRSISCRGAWYLETYDINKEGQVHTYIKYLSYLPYEEQIYWQSFNEWPKGPISRRAFQNDFAGEWSTEYDPLESLKRYVQALDRAEPDWWKAREEELISVAHYPATDSPAEWANDILALDQMLVEGFQIKALRAILTAKEKTFDKSWGSLVILQEVLTEKGLAADDAKNVIAPLRKLHGIRNPLKGHGAVSDRKALEVAARTEFGTFRAHFTKLAADCDEAMKRIVAELIPNLVV